MSLRVSTEFERRHASQADWHLCLRVYNKFEKQVKAYGLQTLSKRNRRLFSKGKRLRAVGFTSCMM